jgi:hypothetical protein
MPLVAGGGGRHSVTIATHQAKEQTMLQQIVSHTPVYVWAILAFLVYRGVAASADRVTSYRSLFIFPALMLALGLQSIASGFGLDGWPGASWLVGAVLGSWLAWTLSGEIAITADRAAGTILQRGSWLPLALMLTIFCSKYAVAVACAMHSELRQSQAFALPVCLLFGLFNGIFIGRAMRGVAACRDAAGGADPVQV